MVPKLVKRCISIVYAISFLSFDDLYPYNSIMNVGAQSKIFHVVHDKWIGASYIDMDIGLTYIRL
ncbi:MAG TPA: hypothetical protein DHV42_00235 [Lachnospiraceae bacterium]|nr:hypothetical protein [Lachnospiraceae bacterium]